MTMKKILTLGILSLALFAFTACNEGGNNTASQKSQASDSTSAQKQDTKGSKKCQANGKCSQGKCANGKKNP